MKIGVISDTHGFLDPTVLKIFAGVGHILHGGDIGQPRLLFELEQIAPVTAVLGNTDHGLDFIRETEVVTLALRRFLIHHIVEPNAPSETLRRRISQSNPDVVVFGHSHRPYWRRHEQVHFLNPGYAGKRRFNLPRSVVILHCNNPEMSAEFIDLDEFSSAASAR